MRRCPRTPTLQTLLEPTRKQHSICGKTEARRWCLRTKTESARRTQPTGAAAKQNRRTMKTQQEQTYLERKRPPNSNERYGNFGQPMTGNLDSS